MGAVNVKAVNKTKIDAGGSGSNMVEMGQFAGVEKVVMDTYTLDAVEATSTIKIATPPKGSQITSIQIFNAGLGGSTVTLSLGYSGAATAFINAAAASSAGLITASAVAVAGYRIGTNALDDEFLITVNTAAGTGAIKTVIRYV